MTGFDLWLEEKVHFSLRSGQPACHPALEKGAQGAENPGPGKERGPAAASHSPASVRR